MAGIRGRHAHRVRAERDERRLDRVAARGQRGGRAPRAGREPRADLPRVLLVVRAGGRVVAAHREPRRLVDLDEVRERVEPVADAPPRAPLVLVRDREREPAPGGRRRASMRRRC